MKEKGRGLTEDQTLAKWIKTPSQKYVDDNKKIFYESSSDLQSQGCDHSKRICKKFYETKEYKSGDTGYEGYIVCCDMCGFCGGMSGWVIFLIIVLVLGVLAGGVAAFWFFYGKRKFGGQEETVDEYTESTENQKSVIEVPIDKSWLCQ